MNPNLIIIADVYRTENEGEFYPRVFINGKDWIGQKTDSYEAAEGFAVSMAKDLTGEVEAYLLDNGYKRP